MELRALFRVWLVLLVCSVAMPARAATKVNATLSSASVSVGESVDFEVFVEGSVRAEQPPAPEVEGLEFRGSSQSSQMSIIGSDVSQRVTYTFRYVARKEGKFNFPEVDVTVGGQHLKTEPRTLTVKPGAPAKGAGDIAFATIEPLKKNAYVGEDIGVEIRAYFDASARWALANKPLLTAEGFNTRDILPVPGNQSEQEMGGKRYGAVVYQTVVTPTKAGKLKLGTATLRAQYSRTRRNPYDPFGGGMGRAEEMEVSAPEVEIDVKPLPVDGRPKDFAGAIGDFTSFEGSGTPTRVKIGEPITMTLTIKGRGNFGRITTPPLADHDGWNAYDSEESFQAGDAHGITGAKVFKLPVSPLVPQTTMPVFLFSFFDPETERYRTLKTDAAPLVVEGAPVAIAPAVVAPQAVPVPIPEAKPDLLPNLPVPDVARSFRPVLTPTLLFGTILAPLPFLAGLLVWRARKSDPLAGPMAALRRERAELAALVRRAENRADLYEAAGRVLQIEAALARREPAMSFDDEEVLATRDLTEPAAAAVRELLAARAELLFAGGGRGERVASVERDRVLDAIAGWERSRPATRFAAARMAVLGALFLFAFTSPLHAGDFEDANAAFAAGKFDDARRGFERVMSEGWQTGALFDLGNTYFRLDQPGRAVLNYERALTLSPGHPDAAANLKFVRERSAGKVGELVWYERVLGAVSSRVAPWLAIGAAWLGWLWAGSALWRRAGAAGVAGGVMLVVLGAIYGAAQLWDSEQRANDAIVLEQTDARREPADRAPLAEALGPGSRVRIISEQGEWTFVRLPSAQKGWLKTGAVERVIPPKHR